MESTLNGEFIFVSPSTSPPDQQWNCRTVVVQSLSHVQLFVTKLTAACQAFLSFPISWGLLTLMSIESVMLSNCLSTQGHAVSPRKALLKECMNDLLNNLQSRVFKPKMFPRLTKPPNSALKSFLSFLQDPGWPSFFSR